MNGVLLFAVQEDIVNFSKPKVNYIELAEYCATQVDKHLDVPVSLVTNISINSKKFDKVIKCNLHSRQTKKIAGEKILWLNFDRCKSWKFTPYKKTLVLDTDFIVKNNTLKNIFDCSNDLLINKTYVDINDRSDNTVERLVPHGIDMYWATVFYFTKNKKTKTFFDLVEHIQNNWYYYRMLYSISNRKFRNDFAFSIALHIMGNPQKELPCNLYLTTDKDLLLSIEKDRYKMLLENDTMCSVNNTNLHIMNKFTLNDKIHQELQNE